jgi:tRNA(Ile)-lysidine synthase
VGKLAESVLEYVRQQSFLKAGDRAGVAVSGGADSVALLRLMLELKQEIGLVLSVVHFNHNLRGAESDADEQFVEQLARRHQLDLYCDRGNVAEHAQVQHLSTEAAARQLRYEYFRRLMVAERLNCIGTGHTLDDQAETVLLRVVRGAGTRGLAGIYPKVIFSQSSGDHSRLIIRPLLCTARTELEAYLREIGQDWREDSSNRDLRYARNRVRHGIVPRLQRTLNPKVREALAETAEIARSEEEYWQAEVEGVLPGMWDLRTGTLAGLADVPLALRRRVVRAAAESLGLRLEFRQVEEILGLSPGSLAQLTEGWVVSRNKNKNNNKKNKKEDGLQFERRAEAEPVSADHGYDYEYVLAVPGMVQVPEAGARFEAAIVPGGSDPGYNPEHTFDPSLVQRKLTVRNWRAGDRFWPAHSKAPKKIKELLQDRKLATKERKLWPVVVSAGEIVWVRGFPTPARLRPREGAKEALVIQEYGQA